MKRLLPIILTLLLLLTACGGDGGAETTGAASEPTYSNEGPEGILDEKDTETVYLLVRMTSLEEDGTERWHREYEYDENGFLVSEREVSSAGTVTYSKQNTPDENGNIGTSEVTEQSGAQYTVKYAYDGFGRITLQETYSEGELTEYSEYSYDEHGNYLTLKSYYAGELVLDYAFAYTYNENGGQLTRDEYLFGELLSHVEMVYDEEGREISSTSSVAGGASLSRTESTWEGLTETRKYYGMADEVPYMTAVITYDENGNVILDQNQYEDGTTSMTEYVYEPFEVKK